MDKEIAERLISSYSENITLPVHFIHLIRILPKDSFWHKRGVMEV